MNRSVSIRRTRVHDSDPGVDGRHDWIRKQVEDGGEQPSAVPVESSCGVWVRQNADEHKHEAGRRAREAWYCPVARESVLSLFLRMPTKSSVFLQTSSANPFPVARRTGAVCGRLAIRRGDPYSAATMGGVALNSTAGGGVGFASTRWNVLIAAAGDTDGTGDKPACAAWEDLYRTYCHPVYAYIRRRGRGRADAQDLTQSFFVHLLEKGTLRRADAAKGRFRTFLLGSLDLFLAESARRERAVKRGGGCHFIFLDDADAAETEYQLTAPAWETPERLFDARWAAALLRRVFAGLREEMASAGKAQLFEGLQIYLAGDEAASYQQSADRLGMSLPALKSHVNRLRVRYAARLREEVARTVAPDDVEDEIRHFCAALRKG